MNRWVSACNTLAYAHSKGILHRDVKPANIVLGQFGETLLVDWGLMKATEMAADPPAPLAGPPRPADGTGTVATLPGAAHGTPGYMSPEQASGRVDELGPATDIYSLGATLYTILTGRTPFAGLGVEEALERVRRGEFPPPRKIVRTVPRALEAICLKAMSLEPDDRYRSATELARDVENWLADEPVSAYREPVIARGWRWCRKHRTAATTSAAVTVLGVLALTLLLARERASASRLAAANVESNRRLDETLEAIEGYYSGVAEDVLLSQPELRELRDRLLEKPREFYERLTRELEHAVARDDRARFLLVKGRLGLARVFATLGRNEEARRQLNDALVTIGELMDAHPANPDYLRAAAEDHFRLGLVRRELGDLRGAADSLRTSIATAEKLAAAHPEVASYRGELAGIYSSLGNVQRDLGDLPAAAETHRRGIRAADDLIRAHPDDPGYLDTSSTGYMNLGNLQREMGDLRAATESLSRSVALRTSLIATRPDVPLYKHKLAGSLLSLASMQSATGDRASARSSLGKAIATLEILVSSQPNVLTYRERLAMARNNLGNLLYALGDREGAVDSFRQSIATYARLQSEHPNVPKYTNGLARAYNNLAESQYLSGQLAQAAESLQRGITVYSGLVSKLPGMPEYQDGLAAAYATLCAVGRDRHNLSESIGSGREAIRIYKRLSDAHPTVVQYRHRLAASHVNLADAQRDAGDLRSARESYGHALELARRVLALAPTVVVHRETLSSGLSGLAQVERAEGRPVQAAELTRQRASLWPKKAGELYQCARDFALCMPLVSERRAPGRVSRQDQLGDEAMATLHRAIAAGWNDWVHLAYDRDFTALHDRRDFQQLAFDRAFPADVFPKAPEER